MSPDAVRTLHARMVQSPDQFAAWIREALSARRELGKDGKAVVVERAPAAPACADVALAVQTAAAAAPQLAPEIWAWASTEYPGCLSGVVEGGGSPGGWGDVFLSGGPGLAGAGGAPGGTLVALPGPAPVVPEPAPILFGLALGAALGWAWLRRKGAAR